MMMKISGRGKALNLALSLLISLSVTGTALADDLEDQLADLQRQAEEQQAKTNEASAKVESVSERLRQIQEELRVATAEYKEVKGQLDSVEDKISDNTELLQKTEADLKVKNKKLQQRVRDIYINGQISYVDVLFGAKDFADLMTRMDVLKRIIKHDYDLIMKVREEKATVENTRAQLEKDKAEAEVLVADAQAKKAKVEDKESEQQVLLDQAIYDRDTSERMYEEIMAASQEVANMIRRSHMSSAGYSGAPAGAGGMIWPISGPITSEFGWRTHPIFGTARFHSGLDIGGDYGMPIYAAASGTVIYAGWISGYGNAVIIDHGGGVTTLYGHNDSLNVSEGENVAQGQVIAMCGSTGNSTGPHCHFEVRENGEPVSPYGYL
ncbi:MAG: peptidoglycan DD-metalloendopeptidase family protein [Veillonellaceae bacterium]|nr:peptidoglycan DD-metalloendopeptidase family protein [Veillonellaceae bacterium]MCI7235584.1 peptidoglycan DD-metalloendopeptidase family protein [Veillonellaceae bacterium]MDD6563312.1 peptidoglycan DD-metalloendopeptidase family protein [Veillonellaceae bacterium]MDD6849193.1 peptidoglycan DD-metalloendopeptidase family protein [Veillonellaceae bacterium]MDY5330323.1 peptidoglycan DD-metalloendopeptidase family protein [Anaerovibrio sp.]